MNTILDNYINGNLTEARRLARGRSWERIYKFLRDETSMTERHARAVADYLKGKGTFQAACDAERQAP